MSLRKTKKSSKEIAIAAAILMAVGILMIVISPWKQEIKPEAAKENFINKTRRSIDGVFVEKENSIAGVMIENMIEAQPISGIADASLVFEALTEANITRFLAYFVLDGSIPEIGPIRSARPYYLDFASPFNTLYTHVGSSPAAYDLLRKVGVEGVQDFDQWYKSEYFWKSNKRSAPHNVYISSASLLEAYNSYKLKSKFDPWKFKNDASPDLRGNVEDITVGYIEPYKVQWLYDKSENQYKRIQWGRAHKDSQGKEIIAKNIAVAFEDMKILDAMGRKSFSTLGEGKGLVFQDGRVVVGVWKKSTPQDMLRFYDIEGKEVDFNAGAAWVEIVPTGYEVKY